MTYKSEKTARGIFMKVVIFSLVGVDHIIDQNIIGDGGEIRTAVIFSYLSNEGISIIENATRLKKIMIGEKFVETLAF